MTVEEILTYSDYMILEAKQSLIDSGKTITIEVGLFCPKCRETIKPEIEHGQTVEHSCGLVMTRYGNSLRCSI